MDTQFIELLAKNIAQLPDWQYREIVVEKINEIISFINNNNTINQEEEEILPKIPNPKEANLSPDVNLKNEIHKGGEVVTE